MKVLAIEDNADDATLIERALGGSVELHFADTGAKGIEMCADQSFDVVLMDYQLGDMTGSEAMARLRERRPGVPVIAVSGLDSHFIVARLLALGACEFISKEDPDFSTRLPKLVHAAAQTRVSPVPKAAPPFSNASAKAGRAEEVYRVLDHALASSDLIGAMGIVGADGAIFRGRVKDRSGAQDVTAVLTGTIQSMLASAAKHLGYGDATSVVADFKKGLIGFTPLPGNLTLYVTSQARPSKSQRLRAELEAVALELHSVMRGPSLSAQPAGPGPGPRM